MVFRGPIEEEVEVERTFPKPSRLLNLYERLQRALGVLLLAISGCLSVRQVIQAPHATVSPKIR